MEEQKKYISIKFAFIAAFLSILIFIFLYIFIGTNHRKNAYADSKLLASEISKSAVNETEQYFNKAFKVAHNLRDISIRLRESKVDRYVVSQLTKEALIENPNFLSVWTMWEHNAYDNKDYLYTNTDLYDSMGNLSVTFFNYFDTIYIEKVKPEDYHENYYTIPKKSKKELLIEPYYYKYKGYPNIYYESSIVIPIIVDTSFLGVFAVDINLEELQKKLNSIRIYKSGYVSLIANSGLIVSHPDSSFIDQNIFQLIDSTDLVVNKVIKQGKHFEYEIISEFTGRKVFRYFFPISGEKNWNPWSIMVEIPAQEVVIRAKQLSIIAIVSLAIGLSLIVYLIFNIIDRRTYEKELVKALLKAEESDRLKTAFLNNISHEIRTPLNGILGFSKLIIRNNLSKDQISSYSRVIVNSSNRLLSIISDVLDLSKIQTGQIKTRIYEFEINKVISGLIDLFKISAEEKGLEIIFNMNKNDTVLISTDENKFIQILSYLIDNAIKFTEKGFVEIGYENKTNYILFHVKDTGKGIKPDNYKNIFNYFTQEDNSTTRNYGGLGAGLYITKSFVNLLGGTIYFKSELDVGTTFYFTIPNNKENL